MESRKTDVKPLRELIYKQLVDDILQGRINSGEKLIESELAERFAVSRTPIREALLHLEKDGYTEHIKNIGATVKKISPQKVAEIFHVVALLEGEAAQMAVQAGISKKEIQYLHRLHEDMIRTSLAKDFIGYNRLNIQFHQFFLDRCQNATLSEIAQDLRKKMYRMVSEGLSLPINIEKYIESHYRILQAVTEKKAKRVCQLMNKHILEASEALVKMMVHRYRQPGKDL